MNAPNHVEVDRESIDAELGQLDQETPLAPGAVDAGNKEAQDENPHGVDWDQALAGSMEMVARIIAPNWAFTDDEKQVIAGQGAQVLGAFFPDFRLEEKWVLLAVFVISTGGIVMKRYDEEAGAFKPLRAPKADTPKGAVSVVKPKGTEETGEDRPAAPISRERPAASFARVPG